MQARHEGDVMKIEFPASRIALATDQFLKLEGARGARIATFSGSVWITQDGDSRDIVLGPRESFVLDSSGPSIVQALEPVELAIAEPAAQRRPGRLVERLKSFGAAARLALGPSAGHTPQAGRL
jgi:hypothetical protein